MTDTKEIDLEQCVNKEYAQIQPIEECKGCEGHDYTCKSYYPIKSFLHTRGKRYDKHDEL